MGNAALQALHDHPVGYAIWVVGSLFTLAVGRTSARIGGVTLLSNVVVSMIWRPEELRTVFWHLLIEDTVVLFVFALILHRYSRQWLLWAVAIQTLAVMSHMPRLIDEGIQNLGYAWFEAALGYLLVATLVAGAYSEGRQNVPRHSVR